MSSIVTVDFHGDVLFAIEQDGEMFVALKPIVGGLGLDWSSQRHRLHRDPILAEGAVIMTIPSLAGGPQETLCLRLDLVNGWLFTIDDRRVRDEATREKVLTYKRECYRVLYDHFYGKARAQVEAESDEQIPEPARDQAAKLRMVCETRLTWGNRAAQQMWFKQGLETVPAMFEPSQQPTLFDHPQDEDEAA